MSGNRRISVTGLGYVGCPVAVAFARAGFMVVGYDLDRSRIDELKIGRDRTGEISADALKTPGLELSADLADLKRADFHIVTVPTPVTSDRRPDLGPLLGAARAVGSQLKIGDIVVFESTVYPGATEDECIPMMEMASGLKCGRDFAVAYSPERINPGDPAHRFETIAKVVSAQDAATLDIVADVYGRVVKAGIHRAPTIRTAEAAKVLENTQRDLNIALMNELAMVCRRLGIDTGDVLAAARTKWNFLNFTPGLVGGHCIGVDPYYLTFKAEQVGHHPMVILAGRQVNDGMGAYVASEVARLASRDATGRLSVAILGITFKEDVPDVRNSRVLDVVRGLTAIGARVQVHDPIADSEIVKAEHGLSLAPLQALTPANAVVLAVAHRFYREQGWPLIARILAGGKGLVADVKGALDRANCPDGVVLWRL